MISAKRRFGGHLSDAAKETLARQRAYPSLAAVRNPLTRALVRNLVEAEWRGALSQIDFPYSVEDRAIGGVRCAMLRPGALSRPGSLLIYLHAGGFVAGSAHANAAAVLPTCRLSACEAIAIDYSLAPEATYPAQINEIETVWRTMLAGGRDPKTIVIVGDSAGAALAVASLYRFREEGLPPPAGLVLLSPLLDAATSSDTYQTMRAVDPLHSGHDRESCENCFRLYAGGADVAHPEISPMNGDPTGFPPTLIHAGTREILLGDAARFAEKARRAGVDVSLRIFDGMFHLFHQHWRLAEAKAAHQDIANFIGMATTPRAQARAAFA